MVHTTNSSESSYVEDWNRHNPELPLEKPKISYKEYETDGLFELYMKDYNKKGNLLLKVRADGTVESGQFILNRDSPLLTFNKEESFFGELDPFALDAEEVKDIILERGRWSGQAYFWAFMEEGKQELILITEPRIPAQTW